jgi:hypothetical protein
MLVLLLAPDMGISPFHVRFCVGTFPQLITGICCGVHTYMVKYARPANILQRLGHRQTEIHISRHKDKTRPQIEKDEGDKETDGDRDKI